MRGRLYLSGAMVLVGLFAAAAFAAGGASGAPDSVTHSLRASSVTGPLLQLPGTTVPSPLWGTVTGTVVDERTQKGLAGVTVEAFTDPGPGQLGELVASTTSLAKGGFELPVPPGTILSLRFSCAGYEPFGPFGIGSVPLQGGRDMGRVPLTPVRSIVGRVLSGWLPGPLSGVLVEVIDRNRLVAAVNTGGDGTFWMRGLGSGTYDARFSREGYETQTLSGVTVVAGGTVVLADLTLMPSLSIRGRVSDAWTGEALPRVHVTVIGDTGGGETSTATVADGTYTLWALRSGTYQLSFSLAGYETLTRDSVLVTSGHTSSVDVALHRMAQPPAISTVTPDTGPPGTSVAIVGTDFGATGTVRFGSTIASVSAWSATSITAAVPEGLPPGVMDVTVSSGGQTSSAVSFTVTAPPGQFAGVVTDGYSGAGLPGVLVEVLLGADVVAEAFTAADGSYDLSQPAGTYGLRFTHADYLSSTTDGVQLAAGQVVTHDVTLQRTPAHLAGTVSDAASGVPLTGHVILSEAVHNGSVVASCITPAWGDAAYGLVIPWGTYELRFSSDTYETLVVEDVAVTSAQPTRLDVALTRGKGYVAGVVTDAATGLPLEGVLVEVVAEGGSGVNGYTAVDGSYRVGVPWGTCQVQFSLAGYFIASVDGVAVVVDEAATVDATLHATMPPGLSVAVAAGDRHTLMVDDKGNLWAWGANDVGQLGLGSADTDAHTTPGRVGLDSDWAIVACGAEHSLALKTDGSLWSWGSNVEGKLGLGTSDSDTHPSPVRVGTDTDWVAVVTGVWHSLALKADGSLWSWGPNAAGKLGLGDLDERWAPTRVGTDSDWVVAAAGWDHTLALKRDGSLWAWGSNRFSALGLGYLEPDHWVPTRVGADNDWATVRCGPDSSLAVKSEGSLWAWGYNGAGYLGLGDTERRWVPTRVGTDADWSSVDGGYFHVLARKIDGSLWAWGANGRGECGLGPDGPYTCLVPTRVGAETDWAVIQAGRHSLGVKSDGGLWVWGTNESGQLGLGDTDDRSAPVLLDL